jgi:hypothetical protein
VLQDKTQDVANEMKESDGCRSKNFEGLKGAKAQRLKLV